MSINKQLNKEGEYRLVGTNIMLRGFNGQLCTAEGTVTMLTETKHGEAMVCEYVVTKSAYRPILGIEACDRLNLVKRVVHSPMEVGAVAEATPLPSLKEEFVQLNKDVFQGLGQFKQVVKIEINKDAPAGMCPPRRYSQAIADRLKTKLNVLVAQGVVA